MDLDQRPAPPADRLLRVALVLSLVLHCAVLLVVERRPSARAFTPRLSIDLRRAPPIATEKAAVPIPAERAQRPPRRAPEPGAPAVPEPASSRPAREARGALNLRIPREHVEAGDVLPGRPLDALPEAPGRRRVPVDPKVEDSARDVAGGRVLDLEQGCFLLVEGQSLSDEPLWWRRPCQPHGETAWRPIDPASVHPSLRSR